MNDISGQAKSKGESFEAQLWSSFDLGWRPLYGRFHSLGYSFEWHEFADKSEVDWSRSFHPESLEICLNIGGTGIIEVGNQKLELKPRTFGFYSVFSASSGKDKIRAIRVADQEHKFLTVELSFSFLKEHLGGVSQSLHPIVRNILEGKEEAAVLSHCERLTMRHQKLLENLKAPPVYAAAQGIWYHSKALEVMSELLFQEPGDDKTLFCVRQQRIAQERVDKVKNLLEDNLAEPLSLEELGKKVGCSHYYLSRTFSKEVGITISQYLRQIRIEKAAELLKTGRFNVTEAALEVGYSSLSHFSHAFQKQIGCCPGLYPMGKNQPDK